MGAKDREGVKTSALREKKGRKVRETLGETDCDEGKIFINELSEKKSQQGSGKKVNQLGLLHCTEMHGHRRGGIYCWQERWAIS